MVVKMSGCSGMSTHLSLHWHQCMNRLLVAPILPHWIVTYQTSVSTWAVWWRLSNEHQWQCTWGWTWTMADLVTQVDTACCLWLCQCGGMDVQMFKHIPTSKSKSSSVYEQAIGGTHTATLDCHLPNKCINLSRMMALELPPSVAMHLRMNLDNGWLGYSSQHHLLVVTLPMWWYGC